MHPNQWAIFLMDDGLQYWSEWGELQGNHEDGHDRYKVEGCQMTVPKDTDFRTEICRLPWYWDPFGTMVETFRVYRGHKGDVNAWSWGSLPGKRLDESVISRIMNGGFVAQELELLEAESKPMDVKVILLIVGAVIVVAAGFYFLVLPRLSGGKAPVVDNQTAVVEPKQTSVEGHWQLNNNEWVWIPG
jgi:hypothetical protein